MFNYDLDLGEESIKLRLSVNGCLKNLIFFNYKSKRIARAPSCRYSTPVFSLDEMGRIPYLDGEEE